MIQLYRELVSMLEQVSDLKSTYCGTIKHFLVSERKVSNVLGSKKPPGFMSFLRMID